MISPRSKGLLVTFTFIATAIIIGLSTSLVLPAQVISASVEGGEGGGTSGTNDTNAIMKFKQHKDNPTAPDPNQEAINHINQAQSALQNGDTAGAQMHMDAAKQALICNPGDPAHC